MKFGISIASSIQIFPSDICINSYYIFLRLRSTTLSNRAYLRGPLAFSMATLDRWQYCRGRWRSLTSWQPDTLRYRQVKWHTALKMILNVSLKNRHTPDIRRIFVLKLWITYMILNFRPISCSPNRVSNVN